MWHELTPNCAFELPMFCRNVDLFPFRRIPGKLYIHICPIFMEGHAEFLYDFVHARIFIINLFYYYRADVHDGQWNDGGQVVAVSGAGHETK